MLRYWAPTSLANFHGSWKHSAFMEIAVKMSQAEDLKAVALKMEGCFWKRSPIFEVSFFAVLICSLLVWSWISFAERSGVGMWGGFQAWMHQGEHGGWEKSARAMSACSGVPHGDWVPCRALWLWLCRLIHCRQALAVVLCTEKVNINNCWRCHILIWWCVEVIWVQIRGSFCFLGGLYPSEPLCVWGLRCW